MPARFSEEQFESIFKLTSILNSADYNGSLTEDVLDLIIDVVDAERGLFTRYDEHTDDFQIIAARNVNKESIASVSEFSSGLLKKVFDDKKPALYHDAQSEPVVSGFESVKLTGIKSVIGVPVFYNEKIWGIFIADSRKQRDKFTDASLRLLELFSNMLSIVLDRIIENEKLKDENVLLQNKLEATEQLPNVIGVSKSMRELSKLIRRVAATDATVLITGESGTGKDLIARAIHELSTRRGKPYLAQFCGSIPDNLLESELFGYKKGAFTGASTDKKGLLEIANEGTFFLDEIGDISATLQAKLLRVLENHGIIRLGDTNLIKVNVRFITATNKNLKEMAKQNKFRSDLFYRINVFPVKIPPLRERKEDIPLLADHFIKMYGDNEVTIDPGAIRKLENYYWPGNVRQLINAIQRALILAENKLIKADHIVLDEIEDEEYSRTLSDITKRELLKRLEEFDGNKALVAKSLGVSRRWIYLKLKEFNESAPN